MKDPLKSKSINYLSLGVDSLYLLLSMILIYIGIQMAYSYFAPIAVPAESLTEIQGRINSREMGTFKARSNPFYNYMITLDSTERNFRVYESPLEYFKFAEFEKEVKKGDAVSLLVKKEDVEKKNANIEIVELKAGGKTWLSAADYYKSYRTNQIYILIGGFFMIFFGWILLKGSYAAVKAGIN